MTRILLFAPETLNFAEVTRCVEVARRLPEFRCVFAGYSERFVSPIREAGFEYRALVPELTDAEAEMAMAFDQGRGLRHPFTISMVQQRVASERALIRELGAEAVVIGTTLSQLISARAEQVPLFYVKPFAYSVPHMTQMRRTGFLPTGTPGQRFVDRSVAWLFRNFLTRALPTPKGFRRAAQQAGVAAPRSAIWFIEADVNLVASPPESLPGNVHVTGWIPVHRLGDLVDVAITHGGEGTVQTSCASGWPFAGIPLQVEQRYNVTRCVEFGNARLVGRRKAAKTDWARVVAYLLTNPAMWEAAGRMARLFEGLDGPDRCAGVIRNHLGAAG